MVLVGGDGRPVRSPTYFHEARPRPAAGTVPATPPEAASTHGGEVMGIEPAKPTNEAVTVTGTGMGRFEDGKTAESRQEFDTFTLLTRVVALPGGTTAATSAPPEAEADPARTQSSPSTAAGSASSSCSAARASSSR